MINRLAGSGPVGVQDLPHSILDNLLEGCQVIGFDWRYLYVNEAAATQGRQTRDALIGRTMMEMYPGINQAPFFAVLRRCMGDRQHATMENEFTFPDGSKGWFELRFVPVPDGVFILSLEITERRRAEEERLRLATAINHSAEAVVITDAAGVIVYVNPAFEAITGYSRREAIGANPRVVKSGTHDDAFYREMWATLLGGRTWRGRIVNRHKNGALFTQDTTISPVFGAGGSIDHYVSVKHDVTNELRLEAQMQQAQKMEAIGQLAGGIAHDFNNLLSVINGYTDFAMQGAADNEAVKADLREIRKAGDRAAALTRQLLVFSRKQVLQPVLMDLNAIVTEIQSMLRPLIGDDIELTSRLAPDLSTVRADPSQIEQVVMNLALNARDAMPRGGTLTIETSNTHLDAEFAGRHIAVQPGAHVMLSVSDTGTGMDPDTKARVFEPFFTTKDQDKGTGLGLSTVYGIVKQSGGSIWVYSELGAGTTFKIYLPSADGTSVGLTPRSRPVVRAVAHETVLLVENEDAVRQLAQRILTAAGYAVVAAANGEEAVAACGEPCGGIHLLLTDVVMPRMSGVALAELVRKVCPDLRVLFMSGYTANAVLRAGEEEAGRNFIGKPFSAADLTRKVRETLDAEG
jgi:PAS domain S-box-containing protein